MKALRLTEETGTQKLTLQLPSRFYFEWLEEHYFGLLRKTITKVLGAEGRLFYEVVIENEDQESGFGRNRHATSCQTARERAPKRQLYQESETAPTWARPETLGKGYHLLPPHSVQLDSALL